MHVTCRDVCNCSIFHDCVYDKYDCSVFHNDGYDKSECSTGQGCDCNKYELSSDLTVSAISTNLLLP